MKDKQEFEFELQLTSATFSANEWKWEVEYEHRSALARQSNQLGYQLHQVQMLLPQGPVIDLPDTILVTIRPKDE